MKIAGWDLHNIQPNTKPCGSELAREDGFTFNTFAD
jgi:hypothetical protein